MSKSISTIKMMMSECLRLRNPFIMKCMRKDAFISLTYSLFYALIFIIKVNYRNWHLRHCANTIDRMKCAKFSLFSPNFRSVFFDCFGYTQMIFGRTNILKTYNELGDKYKWDVMAFFISEIMSLIAHKLWLHKSTFRKQCE